MTPLLVSRTLKSSKVLAHRQGIQFPSGSPFCLPIRAHSSIVCYFLVTTRQDFDDIFSLGCPISELSDPKNPHFFVFRVLLRNAFDTGARGRWFKSHGIECPSRKEIVQLVDTFNKSRNSDQIVTSASRRRLWDNFLLEQTIPYLGIRSFFYFLG